MKITILIPPKKEAEARQHLDKICRAFNLTMVCKWDEPIIPSRPFVNDAQRSTGGPYRQSTGKSCHDVVVTEFMAKGITKFNTKQVADIMVAHGWKKKTNWFAVKTMVERGMAKRDLDGVMGDYLFLGGNHDQE
jgi:hypothetical protein